MRLLKLGVPVLLLALYAFRSSESEDFRVMTSVMTYNVHLENSEEQPTPWDERRSMVAQVIKSREPEIIGLQAATLSQTAWMAEALKNYSYYAPDPGHLDLGADICPILHNSETYESTEEGTFLIGEAILHDEHMDQGKSSRFINWTKLRHRQSGKNVFVINTRIDLCDGEKDEVINERLEGTIQRLVGNETFILLADLTRDPAPEFIREITSWTNDSEVSSLVNISEAEVTNVGWKRTKPLRGERVNYVFLSVDIPTNSYEILDVAYNGEYPSDHLPVYCRLRLQ